MQTPTKQEVQDVLAERHGDALQARFSAARVAVCGLGGLGSNIALSLARSGVGHLHLIDFDRVELSNLHRQQYSLAQLGESKTDALRESLLAINPYLEITTDALRLTADNLPQLLREDGIICEAFDRAEQKALLVNGVLEQFPEKDLVSASGMAGLHSGNTIHTRRVLPHFYLCGDEESDTAAGLGLVAPRVMLCAAHQALTVLRLIAGEREP